MKKTIVCLCVALIGAAAGSYAAEKLPPPLSFHASFDRTLNAVALGDGRPVKVEGPVEYRPGKFGQALLCGDGAAAVFYSTARNLRSASGTVEMWVCPLDWTGGKDTFHVFLEAKNPGWLVFYRYYQGGILMLYGSDARTYRAAAGPRFRWKPGEWHHIAGTWRAKGLEVYVDGKRVGFAASPPMPERLADTFRVGDHPWHVPREQRSLIDEVKLYSAPLDADSIARAARGERIQFKPQLLVELTAHSDTAKLDVMCDAAGLVGDIGVGRTARVELTPRGEDGAIEVAEIKTFPDDVGRCELSVDDVAEGVYDVRVTLADEGGNIVVRNAAPFNMPGPSVWSGNTLGMDDEVLAPWTPLKADRKASKIECWGREYTFGAFLNSVRSKGTALLAKPVRLEAVVGGKTVAFADAACQIAQSSETKATLTARTVAGGLSVAVSHEVEFDGYTWTDLTIEPQTPLRLDELRLTWDMPETQATLMHADSGSWLRNVSGRLKSEGWSSDFVHFFWLGNEERGLAWFAESKQHWRPSSEKPTISVMREGDRVRVIVRLIAEPAKLASKVEYGFGMMATPVRPRPKEARRWRMKPGVRHTFEIIWPNGNMKYYGYPAPLRPKQFSDRVKEAHAKGRLIAPYVNLNYISAGAPEWQYYGRRWADPARAVTPSDVAAMGYASMGVCPNVRDWQDFILYRINEMIDRYQVDGIYIDCWSPLLCKAASCAWKDENGKARGTRPIRAYRRLIKRVYTLFRKKRPNPLLQVHMSSQVNIPMLSFTDTILDGEQFRTGDLKADYLDLLPPDKFRAEFMGRNWGPVAFFLPEFRDEYRALGTADLAVYLLLHDVNAWPIWSDLAIWNRFYDAIDGFGVAEAEFIPYWRDNSGIHGDEQILVSTYRSTGKAMLAIMNTGEAREAKITIDPARLGLSKLTQAADVYSGEGIVVADRSLVVRLKRHQGRLIEVRGAQ